ncbi:MAG: helix-turn-helix transcriptional regulator [Lentisphaerae bacterium]|nr:helix-turn-helix transcriptional regulator [Lentisphaerota bacterium]MCP4102497.1 helix-turn-helix transcriptional regulator [Lentisphaerota bacterium]
MDLAQALLKNQNTTITAIAAELDYSSPYEFSAQFKKYFKIAPLHYMQGSN